MKRFTLEFLDKKISKRYEVLFFSAKKKNLWIEHVSNWINRNCIFSSGIIQFNCSE